MWPRHPPVLAKVWWHNPAWLPGVVGMSVLTMLLELALAAADIGPHGLVLLQQPAQPAQGFTGQLLRGLGTEILAGELLKQNSP